MKTFSQSKEAANASRKWVLVDAENQTLGRLASKIALRLRGKHRPEYTPHVDGGDFVVVINASKIRLSGNKLSSKFYYRHSGYMGGIKSTSAEALLEKHPERLITFAVEGMLPKGPLGKAMAKKLKVYADGNHPHTAQNPERLQLGAVN